MKRPLFLLAAFFFFLPCYLFAQDLTGVWRGEFHTESGDVYRYEVQIDHTNSTLSGVTYSYQDRKFYGKATFTGNFNKNTKNALVQEIRTVEVRMAVGSMSCIQKCRLTYVRSGKEEFLEGEFTSIFEKTDSIYGYMRGEDCGGGTMMLRKVPNTDFYLEPFLRKRSVPLPEVKPPIVKNTETRPPAKKDVPVVKNTTTKPKTEPARKTDTATRKEPEVVINQSKKPAINIPAPLKTRENNIIQTLTVTTEEVIVKLYDNGEIDDDTISVYLDNKLVLSKKRLTAAALEVKLKMDEEDPSHELVMVAENLGRIPPNTSLMVVTSGDKRYEVRITSTEQKNAVVRFRYVKAK